MAPLMAQLRAEHDARVTAERALIECIRIMDADQFNELRSTFRFLDNLGGVSGGPGG